MDPLSVISLIFLFLLMLGLGIAVNIERFQEKFAKPKGITIGMICQFLLMPPLVRSNFMMFVSITF